MLKFWEVKISLHEVQSFAQAKLDAVFTFIIFSMLTYKIFGLTDVELVTKILIVLV